MINLAAELVWVSENWPSLCWQVYPKLVTLPGTILQVTGDCWSVAQINKGAAVQCTKKKRMVKEEWGFQCLSIVKLIMCFSLVMTCTNGGKGG